MKSYLIQTEEGHFDEALNDIQGKDIQLFLLFTSTRLCKEGGLPQKIKSMFPDAKLLGCSTSGEIGERIEDDSVTLMGMTFEKSGFKCTSVPVNGSEGSRAAGRALAEKLAADDLAGVFVLMPGLNVNGS